MSVIATLATMPVANVVLGAGDATALFKNWTATLANWIEIVAAAVIALAVIEATLRVVVVFMRRRISPAAKETLRLHLARWLAVSLEFELAADILRTAIAPSWDEIGKLAAIAAIRTLLNYFLEKEIQRAARDQTGNLAPKPAYRQSAIPWELLWRRGDATGAPGPTTQEESRREPSAV